jgi:hypothetical protein
MMIYKEQLGKYLPGAARQLRVLQRQQASALL